MMRSGCLSECLERSSVAARCTSSNAVMACRIIGWNFDSVQMNPHDQDVQFETRT